MIAASLKSLCQVGLKTKTCPFYSPPHLEEICCGDKLPRSQAGHEALDQSTLSLNKVRAETQTGESYQTTWMRTNHRGTRTHQAERKSWQQPEPPSSSADHRCSGHHASLSWPRHWSAEGQSHSYIVTRPFSSLFHKKSLSHFCYLSYLAVCCCEILLLGFL